MDIEIKEITSSLTALHDLLKEKNDTLTKETQTMQVLSSICRLPKAVLIKILMFLDFRSDISSIVETCKFFNSFIASRPFQLILYRSISTKTEKKKELSKEEEKTNVAEANALLTREEVIARIKKTKAINNMLVAGFQKSEEKLKDMIKTINKLNDEVTYT